MSLKSVALFSWGLSGGAITNVVATLAKGFVALKVPKVYIVYLHDAATKDKRVDLPPEVELIPLGVKQTKLSFIAIARFLRRYQPDIFISLAFLNLPSIVGYLLAGKIPTKLIISQHNSMLYQAEVEHQGNWLFQAQVWLAKYLYPFASGLVATTQPVLAELTQQIGIALPNTQTKVIPNALDIKRIKIQGQKPATHPWLVNKDTPVIVSVGRLAKQKNFPLLLAALKLVRAKIPARLIIFGEGKEREELTKLIQEMDLAEHVSLAGFCPNPYAEMAQADVFALASEEEAFGLVLVEAMVSGTAVVATDAMGAGPRSIIEADRYGLLVPNRNSQELAQAISQILTDFEQRDRFILAGYQKCQLYQPEIVVQQWLDFSEQLLTNNH